MPLRFSYELAASWPSLAWLAQCETGSDSIRLVHGPGVECRTDWFCEAVWDGDFAAGELDRTDLVFGSGGRARDGRVTFVSAGAPIDRLQFAVRDKVTFVSNSLACLLEGINARFDPDFHGYDEFFEQVVLGIDREFPDLPIAGGGVGMMYFHNLEWDGERLHRTPKPPSQRDFGTFEKYEGFFTGALRRIGDNMASGDRSAPLEWLGTISQGYDSPTCAAAARAAGLKQVFTHDESRPGTRDDGVEIARILGVDCVMVDRLAWKGRPAPEPLFLAADAQGKEVMLAGIPLDLNRRVMLTGHGGDRAWSKEFHPRRLPAYPALKPGPPASLAGRWHSGLSMTEYRLHQGYIHLPAPFMGLRQIADLHTLSESDEMAPWDVAGSYSRPICRRIVEQAGVPRNLFGTAKTGASIRFLRGEDSWSASGKRAFFGWLRLHGADHGMSRRALAQVRLLLRAQDVALSLGRLKPAFAGRRMRTVAIRLARRIKQSGLNDLAFIWAIDSVRKSYRRPPG
ncbi:MAG: hypothetical protein ABIO69_05490 [Sphingomicrobium sp.]